MTTRTRRASAIIALAVTAAVAACGDDATPGSSPALEDVAAPVIDPGDGGEYRPSIDAAAFAGDIDNPYLPFLPGWRWVYEGESDGEIEQVVVTVTGDRHEVMGVSTWVVRDTVHVDGMLVEDTYDWFAQDTEGNVWYFGEDVENYEDGRLVDTEGSWEAGVDGALPGIVMPAEPETGHAYRQEFWPGEAEDLAEIIGTSGSVTVPAGTFDDVIVTRDWNPLEPEVVEEKSYAAGVGLVHEKKVAGETGTVRLVEFSRGD